MKNPKLKTWPYSLTKPQVIKLRVSFSGIQLIKAEQDIFENLLENFMHQLLEELYLPAKIHLSVKWAIDQPPELISYKIIIHSYICKIPLSSEEDTDTNGRRLASKIAGYVLLNKSYLINGALTNIIRNSLPQESELKKLQLLEFKELIMSMVGRGFSMHRLIGLSPNRITNILQNRYLLEALIQEVDSTTIRVRYNTAYDELTNSEKLNDLFLLMQEGLFYELGIIVPKMDWIIDKNLADNEFILQINDISHPIYFGLKPEEILVNDNQEKLKLLNIEGRSTKNPASGQLGTIVDKSFSEECEKAGLTIWNPPGYLILCLSHQLTKQAGSLLTADLVENHLNELRLDFPDLIDTFLDQYDLFTFTKILKDLLDEELTIRGMRTILDNLLMINGTIQIDPDKIILYPEGSHLLQTECDKIGNSKSWEFATYLSRKTALQAYISYKYTQGTNTLTVFLLDPKIEETIRNLKGKNLPHIQHQQLIETIQHQIFQKGKAHLHPVILTTVDVRHVLRKIIETELPQLPVLSYEELSPQLNIQPISRISFSG